MRIRHAAGAGGALRVGYQKAATLGAWSVVPDGQAPLSSPRFVITAQVLDANAFWIARKVFSLALQLADSVEWVWKDVEVEPNSQQIVVTVDRRPAVVRI